MIADFGGTVAEFGGMIAELGGTVAEFGGVSADFGGTVAEFGGTPADFGGITSDFGGMTSDFAGTTAEFGEPSSDIGGALLDFGEIGLEVGGVDADLSGRTGESRGAAAADGGMFHGVLRLDAALWFGGLTPRDLPRRESSFATQSGVKPPHSREAHGEVRRPSPNIGAEDENSGRGEATALPIPVALLDSTSIMASSPPATDGEKRMCDF
jgi:hypothetical protein